MPGLLAKPTIDILVGLRSLALTPAIRDAMAELRYEHRPELSTEDRLFFGKGRYTDRPFNAHFVLLGGPVWGEDLLFRDYLRADLNERPPMPRSNAGRPLCRTGTANARLHSSRPLELARAAAAESKRAGARLNRA